MDSGRRWLLNHQTHLGAAKSTSSSPREGPSCRIKFGQALTPVLFNNMADTTTAIFRHQQSVHEAAPQVLCSGRGL